MYMIELNQTNQLIIPETPDISLKEIENELCQVISGPIHPIKSKHVIS